MSLPAAPLHPRYLAQIRNLTLLCSFEGRVATDAGNSMKADKYPDYARTNCGVSTPTFLVCLLIACTAPSAGAALEPRQVLVLVNKDTPISSQVGRMYQKLREIPAANIVSLSLGTERQITPEQYWSKAAPPIRKYLEANPEIRCILT